MRGLNAAREPQADAKQAGVETLVACAIRVCPTRLVVSVRAREAAKARREGIRRRRFAALLVLLLATELVPLRAELPLARLSTVFPPGGRQGTVIDVTATGADLDDADRVYFSHPGITAALKTSDSHQRAPNQFVVTIGAGVAPGVYDARVIGRFGITNPRAFVVGDRPESIEAATNHSAATAMTVPLGTVINGRVQPDAVDYLGFAAKQGQRVLIACAARAIDSRMDPVLVLNDGSGNELERDRSGGLLDFTAPAEGRYLLQVHDRLYRGGDEYFYRLELGTGPRLDFVLPPCGQPGSTGRFVLYGRNLPGGAPVNDLRLGGKPLEELAVEIHLPGEPRSAPWLPADLLALPAAAVIEGFEYRLRLPGGDSNPALIGFTGAPVVTEQRPAATAESAQEVPLPCEFVGRFHAHSGVTWITFEAEKGDVCWLEIFSQRLGWPAEPFLLVQRLTKNAKGEHRVSDVQEVYSADANIGGPGFNTSTHDPAWRFEVKEPGPYRVQVRDLFNENDPDAGAVYRLSIRKETPDFRLVALPQAPPPANKDSKEIRLWTTFLRRGETTPIKVLALRRDHFEGEIQLTVEGLPSGVSAGESTIAGSENAAPLLLTAAENAPAWFGPIRIVGRAKVGGSTLVSEAWGGTVVWNVGDYSTEAVQARLAREFALAVSGEETAPISIEVAAQKPWRTPVGGRLKIPLKLVRRAEAKGKLKVKAAGLAALDSAKETDVDDKATNAVLELDLTQQKIPAGIHTVHVELQADVRYRRLRPDAVKAADAEAKTVEEQARQVEQSAAEIKAVAAKAAERFAAAKQAAEEAAALARPLDEKLAVARAACEKSPADPLLIAARMAAEQEAAEADARCRGAAELKASAEKVSNELSAQLREAEKKKEAMMNHAKAATQKVQSQDVAVTVYSPAIRLNVTALPIKEAKTR